MLLVTTTTVEGSGLLDELVAAYHASQDRFRLSTTAVGSGAALELGRRGEPDILLTHDPVGEERFMAEGHGRDQGLVMQNEFVLVGPPADSADVDGFTELGDALDRIRAAGAPFVSRGDDSGTHARELQLWERSGAVPAPESAGDWYILSGSGMAETLRLADQRGAYTLTDGGTFRHLRDALGLAVMSEGEPPEQNRYRYTIPANPRNVAGAIDFRDWLLGPGQTLIGRYGVERFGEPLFEPAGSPSPGD